MHHTLTDAQHTAAEAIAALLALIERARCGDRFATREELRQLLTEPLSRYPAFNGEADAIEKVARFLARSETSREVVRRIMGALDREMWNREFDRQDEASAAGESDAAERQRERRQMGIGS